MPEDTTNPKVKYQEFGGTAGSESYVDDGWGYVRLRGDSMRRERIDAGAMRYHADHEWNKPVGVVDSMVYNGVDGFDYTVRIPYERYDEKSESYVEVEYNKDFREQRDTGVRGSNSLGFRIHDIMFVSAGKAPWEDKFDATDWEPLELSDVTVPADVLAMEKPDFARSLGYSSDRDAIIRCGAGVGVINRSLLERVEAQRKEARNNIVEVADMPKTSVFDRIKSVISKRDERDAGDIIDELEEVLEDVEDAAYDEMEGEREVEAREGDDMDDEDEERMEDDEEHDAEREVEVREPEQRSTPESRAEARRERKEAEKVEKNTKRSNKYGSHIVNPNPSLSYEKHGLDGSRSIQRMFALQCGAGAAARTKERSREIGWLEQRAGSESIAPYMNSDATFVLPFEFLSETGVRGKYTEEYKMGKARRLRPAARAAVTQANDSGGGTMSNLVDVDNSMSWLYDTAPILEYIVVDTGKQSRITVYHGATKPVINWPGDGGTFDEVEPNVDEIMLSPVPVGTKWSLSGGLLKGSAVNAAELFQQGAENLLWNEVTKGVLSGKNVGANGAEVANSITGLINSGAALTGYGANDNAFGRDDVVASINRLVTNQAMGENHVWFMSPGFASLANNTLRGGAASSLYLFERDENIRTGMMEGAPAVITTLLQKASVVNPAFNLYGSRVLLVIWGNGVEVRMFSPPNADFVEFGVQMHINMAVVNPLNADGLRQNA